jgi:hypothetical protein
MSTPMPPKLKLQVLDTYTPRHARRQASDENMGSPPWARRHAEDDEQREPGEAAGDTLVAPGSGQPAHERLDDAIKQAIEIACSDDEAETADAEGEADDAESEADEPEVETEDAEAEADGEEEADDEARLPPAPTLPPRPSGAAARPSPAAGARRSDRNSVQEEARRRRGLEPEVLPAPPLGAESRMASPLLRSVVVIGFAAIAAYAVTIMMPSRTPFPLPTPIAEKPVETVPVAQDPSTTFPPAPARSATLEPTLEKSARLVVQNKQSFTNQPVKLGISVDGGTGHESLLLAGLTAGTRLSAGEQIGDTRWQLALNQLRNVYMYAPKDFVGVMNTAVDLLSPSAQLVDTKPVQFAWIARAPEPPVDRVVQGQHIAPVQPKDLAQEALMLKRGEDLLNIGDIAGARSVFQYLADEGNAEAALAMGATYDARFLSAHNAIGVSANDDKARSWYQRAADLGSAQAKTLLAQIAN